MKPSQSIQPSFSSGCALEDRELEIIIKGLGLATLAAAQVEAKGETKDRAPRIRNEALKLLTGGYAESPHQMGLSELLACSFGMALDCEIDLSSYNKKGSPRGLRGFIAHNENSIVLSYASKTAAFDWIEEMDLSTAEWDTKEREQIILDFATMFRVCTTGAEYKPPVHAGFYHDFCATLPLIKKHIVPLLQPDKPRRSLFVVGDSIGGGVASLATCYFMLEFDWRELDHKLVEVTGGSPQSCSAHMKACMDERRKELGDSALLFRVAEDNDIVPMTPPRSYGFQHLTSAIRLDKEGHISKHSGPRVETGSDSAFAPVCTLTTCQGFEEEETGQSDHGSKIHKSLRSHTPTAYLEPFLRAKGVSSVAELRLKRMTPKAHKQKGTLEMEFAESVHMNSKIVAAPMAKQTSWWRKPKMPRRAPNAKKRRQPSEKQARKDG